MQEANVESYHQSSDQDRNESLNSKEGNLCETDVDAAILAADQVRLLFYLMFSPKTTNTTIQ